MTQQQRKRMRKTERRLLRRVRERGRVYVRPADDPWNVRAARRLVRDGRLYAAISKFDLLGTCGPWTCRELAVAEDLRKIEHYTYKLFGRGKSR